MSSSTKTNEPCANWWPNVNPPYKADPTMPHPLCTLCANWKRVEDIEDICSITSLHAKPCYNYYNATNNANNKMK